MEWNAWTQTETYLLVEKLSSSTQAEEWREVVEQCDSSASFETEAFQLKARRKYACVKGISFESVTLADVEKSLQGLAGWADINVTVPGIEDASTEPGASSGLSTPSSVSRKRSHSQDIETPEPEEKKKRAKGTPKTAANTKSKADGEDKRKKKAGLSNEQKDLEKSAKNLICLIHKSQQVVDKITDKVDEFPSEWSWVKSFLADFGKLQEALKAALTPQDGDDLAEFVDELKLSVISPSECKAMKKRFGSRFFPMLTLFTDRCTAVSNQYLDFKAKLLKPHNLLKLPSQALETEAMAYKC